MEPSAHLLPTDRLLASGQSRDALVRAVRRGSLVRIRRGWYCLGETWRGMDERERHVLRAAAVVHSVAEPVLAGRSAAAVWGMPFLDWPAEVVLLTPFRGGGRSEPGVRRTVVGAVGAPVTRHRGLPLTTLARTVVDIAASEGFVAGTVCADWALRNGVDRGELRDALRSRTSSYGATVAAAVVDFADAAAENGGESTARASIVMLGFAVPELQVVVRDWVGEMRADFRWTRADGSYLFGEFDGKQKYTRDEFTRGDAGEAVWREKKREDRLRVHGGVVRILCSHLHDASALVALLSEAGVPRGGTARSDTRARPSEVAVIQQSGSPSAVRRVADRLDG